MIVPLLLLFAAPPALSAADRDAAYAAAGLERRAGGWGSCADDPEARGSIEQVIDLNDDGKPEAVIEEGSMACSGDVPAYWIVTRDPPGKWRLVTSGRGMISALPGKGTGGWRDLEIGGAGFCFPVERWNGREYALQGHQYEGKPCRPQR